MLSDEQIKGLDSMMASMTIVNQAPMSSAGWRVLEIACRNGGFVQAGTGSHNGRVERVAASAILALVRRGYLDHCYGTEGGVAGRLSDRSRQRLSEVVCASGI